MNLSALEARLAASDDPREKADAMTALAWEISTHYGNQERARALAQEAFVLCRDTIDWQGGRAQALIVTANVQRIEGAYELAIRHARSALDMQEAVGIQDQWTGRAWSVIGGCYRRLGDYTASAEAIERQLQVAEALGDALYKADALKSMGILASLQGDYRGALAHYEASNEFYASIGHIVGLAANYNNASVEYRQLGEYAQAREQALKALKLFEKEAYEQGIIRAHINLAHVATDTDALDQAEYHYQEAMRLALQSGERYVLTEACLALGRLSLKQGDLNKALAKTQEALALTQSSADKGLQYQCYEQLAEIYEARGDWPSALDAYKMFHHLKEQVLNETSIRQLKNLEVRWRTEQALKSAEQERQLRAADRDYFARISRMKDDFVNAATHDLKNPLSHIFLLVQLLRRRGLVLTEGLELLERIEASANQMRQLIADLLDIAQLETGRLLQLEPSDVVALVRRIAQSFFWLAAPKSLDFALDLPKRTVTLHLDVTQFTHALENIFSNAIKYTPQGGQIRCSLQVESGDVVIRIADSGIGIPPQALPHIFERFYRVTSEAHQAIEGTGLGLYIVKSVIEQHGGRVWAESEVGCGTTFFIRLPL